MIAVRDGFGDHMHPKWWLLQENIKIYLPTEHGIPIWQQTLQKNERSRQGEVLQGKGGLRENHRPGHCLLQHIKCSAGCFRCHQVHQSWLRSAKYQEHRVGGRVLQQPMCGAPLWPGVQGLGEGAEPRRGGHWPGTDSENIANFGVKSSGERNMITECVWKIK